MAFRVCAFVGLVLVERNTACFFAAGFLASGLRPFPGDALAIFFFGNAFFVTRVVNFFAAEADFFLADGTFLAGAAFFAFGAVVILPGRFGFREVAFLPFVARILFDADKPLLVAFVTRLLISHLEVENEPLHI